MTQQRWHNRFAFAAVMSLILAVGLVGATLAWRKWPRVPWVSTVVRSGWCSQVGCSAIRRDS